MNRSQKNSLYLIIGFLVLAIGLFAYQNIVMPAQQTADRVLVYVAGTNLSDKTVINASDTSQFKAVQISGDSLLHDSVTNLDSVNGKVIEGGLLEGELLRMKRLSDAKTDEGELFIKIEPDYPIDIRDGENIAVFVRGVNEKTRMDEVVQLFAQKKVHSSSRVTNLLEGESTQGYYLNVTANELEAYYLAKNKGVIIAAKISPTSKDVTKVENTIGALQRLSNLPEEVEEPEDDSESSVANNEAVPGDDYETQPGDTYESIAHDHQVSVDALKRQNPNIGEVREGIIITIPGEN